MIKNNVSVQAATELLKSSLVGALSDAPNVSDSHISLKTGVHRKDVRRLRADRMAQTTKKAPVPPVALVMNAWAHSEMFQSEDGAPRTLTRSEFGKLARRSKVDLPPATLLSEMFAQDLVREDDGKLTLLSTVFVPKIGDAAIAAFEATILDHLRIAVDNTIADGTTSAAFDRAVRYSNLSDASVQKLEAHARKTAMEYLNELNTLAYALQQADDADTASHTGRFVSGTYIAPISDHLEQDKDPS